MRYFSFIVLLKAMVITSLQSWSKLVLFGFEETTPSLALLSLYGGYGSSLPADLSSSIPSSSSFKYPYRGWPWSPGPRHTFPTYLFSGTTRYHSVHVSITLPTPLPGRTWMWSSLSEPNSRTSPGFLRIWSCTELLATCLSPRDRHLPEKGADSEMARKGPCWSSWIQQAQSQAIFELQWHSQYILLFWFSHSRTLPMCCFAEDSCRVSWEIQTGPSFLSKLLSLQFGTFTSRCAAFSLPWPSRSWLSAFLYHLPFQIKVLCLFQCKLIWIPHSTSCQHLFISCTPSVCRWWQINGDVVTSIKL